MIEQKQKTSGKPAGHSHAPRNSHNPQDPRNPDKKDLRTLQRSQRDRWMKPVVRHVRVLRETAHKEQQRETGVEAGGLKIVHFGGLGEVGRNMSAVQYDDEIILIDAGVRFPETDMPGIDRATRPMPPSVIIHFIIICLYRQKIPRNFRFTGLCNAYSWRALRRSRQVHRRQVSECRTD